MGDNLWWAWAISVGWQVQQELPLQRVSCYSKGEQDARKRSLHTVRAWAITFWAAGAAKVTPAKGFPAAPGVSEMPAKGLLPALPAAAGAASGTGAGAAGCPPRRALKIFLFFSCVSSARAKPSPGS